MHRIVREIKGELFSHALVRIGDQPIDVIPPCFQQEPHLDWEIQIQELPPSGCETEFLSRPTFKQSSHLNKRVEKIKRPDIKFSTEFIYPVPNLCVQHRRIDEHGSYFPDGFESQVAGGLGSPDAVVIQICKQGDSIPT